MPGKQILTDSQPRDGSGQKRGASMDGILSGLINLGLGGLMAAALIWFLYYLVSRTLPEMTRLFRKEILAERKLRFREHQALLQMMDLLAKQQQEQHEALLAHVDMGLKEVMRLFTESQAAIERRLAAWQAAGAGSQQGPKPRQP
jgi:hypothetical protein